MSSQPLQAYFKFDDEDLAANRAGRLSEAQAARLRREAVSGMGCTSFFLLGIAAALLIGGLILLGDGALSLRGPALAGLAGWLIGMLVPAGLGLSSLRAALSPDLRLRRASGPVEFRNPPASGRSRRARHFLSLAGQTFELSGDLSQHMPPGQVFAVYYTGDRTIVSVEALAAGAAG